MKLKLALVSAAVLLAFVVGISIVAANHASDGPECSDIPGANIPIFPEDPACDAPPPIAYLGGSFKTIPASVASELDLVEGVEISTIESWTRAARAGLHAASGRRTVNGDSYPTGGDVITAVDGRKVTYARELLKLIDAKRPGDTVSITYSREGRTDTVQVELSCAAGSC